MKMKVLALVAGALALSGCASSSSTPASPRAVAPASAAEQAALLDQVKKLQGTWKAETPYGDGTITYAVSSGGSSVREVMFPGEQHEMTNMYHMDGSTLLMTHYCGGGNQPRMRATVGKPGEIDLNYDSVTNLHKSDAEFMSGLRIVFVDKDHIREEWKMMQNGKVTDGPVFKLTRVN